MTLITRDSGQDRDAQALLRVARGDRTAFTELYDRHHAAVLRFAQRFVGNAARAEELMQEVFVKLYQSAAAYRPTASFKTFLFRVATNHCLNEVRRGEYRYTQVEPHADGDTSKQVEQLSIDAQGPDATLAGKELERAVNQALSELSERERAAFSMARFEGMAYREIADVLSASEAAVKSLVHRATLSVAREVEAHQAKTHAAGSLE